MNETIVFPDVGGIAITYLKSVLPNVSISTKVPNPRPDQYIEVTVVGGLRARINADSSMVTFQCWDSDSVKASELARLARAHMHALAGETVNGTWVYRVTDVGGPSFNPDPESDKPRYQFTITIDAKGAAL